MPHWDMTVIYPGLDSPAFEQGFQDAVQSIADLGALFDTHRIGGKDSAAAEEPLGDEQAVRVFETATARYNALLEEVSTLRAYIGAFVATDSRNALAQAKMSELRRHFVALSQLSTRFTAWVGTLDVEALIEKSPLAADHAHFLRKSALSARHLMPPGEEALAAELAQAGSSAWAKLHGDLTSQITVALAKKPDGLAEDTPMSVVRTLALNPDPQTRRRAYEAEIAAWERAALPLAAAMNGIKQEANILSSRRGWGSPLDVSLFYNNIDRETLDAMLSAARASFPDFRRYLRAKARVVSGQERLPWHDLFAPVGESARTWEWNEAETFVAEQFGTYSDKMRAFAARAFRERWIDAEPRPGKRDGAFCMGLRRDESRIAQNYAPSFNQVSTLAHELGHGYHNLCLAERTPLQKGTPMTLAETASIFCETIIRQAALEKTEKQDQLAILEASLQSACQVVVDITSRFLFEQRVLEQRRERELSVQELCDTMRDAQRETYGDGLDENALHPYMWAVKGHYYGASFYNYPYMFGLLFGLGLYARYRTDPDAFRSGYDELLSLTGMADAATLAARFDINLRSEAFWTASLDIIRQDIHRFESLTIG